MVDVEHGPHKTGHKSKIACWLLHELSSPSQMDGSGVVGHGAAVVDVAAAVVVGAAVAVVGGAVQRPHMAPHPERVKLFVHKSTGPPGTQRSRSG